MSWIALHRSEEAQALLERYPNAFLLLTQIAMRARYHDDSCPVTKLAPGEAMIGDWRRAGLPSEKAYRVAKQVLLEGGLVVFRGANKGTVAKLVGSKVFSIQADVQGRTKGEQRGSLGATNNKETNNKEESKTPDLEAMARNIVEHYPRREGWSEAISIVFAQLIDGEDGEKMLAGTKAAAAVIREGQGGAAGRFVPSAETFFRKKRWADDPATLRRREAPGDKHSHQTNGYNERRDF